jgi:hypothetical protein
MAETAVIVSFALLLLLGALQIFLLGFGQISSDGASFVAALAASTGYANPQGLGSTIFPGIKEVNITTNAGGGTVVAKASIGVPGLGAMPGLGALTTEQGADIEPYTTLSQGIGPQLFTFAVTANLSNYCSDGTMCTSNYAMTLAQHLSQYGNGTNGQFEEWGCHATVYASLAFPATLPTPGPTWDVNNSGSSEHTIYAWDTGTAC